MEVCDEQELHNSENTEMISEQSNEMIETSAPMRTESLQRCGDSLAPLQIPESMNDGDVQSTPMPSVAVIMPSLRGKLVSNGAAVSCRGVWGMNDAAHDQLGQTSDFEFKLAKANAGSVFPNSGKYQGWFMLKQPAPIKDIKIEDKDMMLTFTNAGDKFTIEGKGSNKFGTFLLHGHMELNGEIQLYREYLAKPLPAPSKRKSGASEAAVAPKSAAQAVEVATTPREPTGRVRKQSSLMVGYDDVGYGGATPRQSAGTSPRPKGATVAASNQSLITELKRQESAGRAQRISLHMQKCGDLLKEIMKNPHAIWFAEPVDYVKLNLPDYPGIISQPMDFRTIRESIEAGRYEAPDQFAEHMRLVFRNAITYNQLKDNPVHIAARELNAKFGDRFRQLEIQLGSSSTAYTAQYVAESKADRAGWGKSKSPRASLSGAGASKAKTPSGPGPRADAGYLLPPAVDAGGAQFFDLQRKMQEMQDEINNLRSVVRQTEIKNTLETQRDAARNPLSYDEKKQLISQIHRLPAEHMEFVVETIQAAMAARGGSAGGDGDADIEVPLDELDTLTLRKLQRFIEDVNSKKKRSAPPVPASTTAKKPRTSKPIAKAGTATSASSSYDNHHQQQQSISHEDGSFNEESTEDAFLFPADSLEDLAPISSSSPMTSAMTAPTADELSQQKANAGTVKEPLHSAMLLTDQMLVDSLQSFTNQASAVTNVTVAHAAAWGSHTTSSSSSSSSCSSSTSANNMRKSESWVAAGEDALAKRHREAQRLQEEQHAQEQRLRQDLERRNAIVQEASNNSQQHTEIAALAEQKKTHEQHEQDELDRQRLQARRERDAMEATVHISGGGDDLDFF